MTAELKASLQVVQYQDTKSTVVGLDLMDIGIDSLRKHFCNSLILRLSFPGFIALNREIDLGTILTS